MFVGELDEGTGQVPSPVEAHHLGLHVPRGRLVQLLYPSYLVRRRARRLEVHVVCKKEALLVDSVRRHPDSTHAQRLPSDFLPEPVNYGAHLPPTLYMLAVIFKARSDHSFPKS